MHRRLISWSWRRRSCLRRSRSRSSITSGASRNRVQIRSENAKRWGIFDEKWVLFVEEWWFSDDFLIIFWWKLMIFWWTMLLFLWRKQPWELGRRRVAQRAGGRWPFGTDEIHDLSHEIHHLWIYFGLNRISFVVAGAGPASGVCSEKWWFFVETCWNSLEKWWFYG